MKVKRKAAPHAEQQNAIGYCHMIISSRAYGNAHKCPRFVIWADEHESDAIWHLATALKMPMLNRAGHGLVLTGATLQIVDVISGALLWSE